MKTDATLEAARSEAVQKLSEAMEAFVVSLRDCYNLGMWPSEALRATGLEVPDIARGMIDAPLVGILTKAGEIEGG